MAISEVPAHFNQRTQHREESRLNRVQVNSQMANLSSLLSYRTESEAGAELHAPRASGAMMVGAVAVGALTRLDTDGRIC